MLCFLFLATTLFTCLSDLFHVFQPVRLLAYVSVSPSSVCQPVLCQPTVCRPVPVSLSVRFSVCLSVSPSVCLSVCLSLCLSVFVAKGKTLVEFREILPRHFLDFN